MEKKEKTERPVDRIRQLARWYIDNGAITSVKSFEIAAGLSSNYIKNLYQTEKGNPGVDTVAKIYRTFAGVSLKWLVLGEGKMFTIPDEKALENARDAVRDYKVMRGVKRMLGKHSKEELIAIIEKM